MTALKIRPITAEELAAYYAGGKRKMIAGTPCRVAKHYGKAPGKDTIAHCAAVGAGIEYMEEATRFRFAPVDGERATDGKPSGRGSMTCGNGNPLKLKNWRPASLSLAPQYDCAMVGASWELTKARKAWHRGDAGPLREYLAEQAAERRAAAEFAAEPYQLPLAA